MIAALYYQIFLYNSRIIKESDPHLRSCFIMSLSEGFILNGILDFISLKYYCFRIDFRIYFGITVIIFIINAIYFLLYKKGMQIVDDKPLYFNSKRVSSICAFFFFFVSNTWVIWGGIYGRSLYSDCFSGL